ncbi:unnamed protein product [Oikopleura dioica]|uniref:Uncharacterized protein n=1 Tax=Oikopleura dioica TaxID=34765 RepID=E4X0I2_OIKDI|nr:unnamed protein product [Oikopleura dioica]
MKKQKKVYSPLQDDRNIKKCQIWRFPNEEIERVLLNGKITYCYKTTGYDIFCPACNLFFKKKDDYQVHLMILQQVEPIKDEIRDTIRYMKDYLSKKAHELKPLHERYPRLLACAKARSERITKKLVTFSKSLEDLQNCYDHQQQVHGDKQLNKWPKKKPAEDIDRNQPKRWFNAVVAMRKMKDAKDRLYEIRRKRAYREAYRQKDESRKELKIYREFKPARQNWTICCSFEFA